MTNRITLTSLALGFSLAAAVAQTNSLQLSMMPKARLSAPRDSLTNYSYPEWFRDAKFGIWAHWGPQAVPMEGDWYARKMYQQGHARLRRIISNAGAIRPPTAGRTSSRSGKPRIGIRRS